MLAEFRKRKWPVLYPHVAPKVSTDGGRLAEKVPAIMNIAARGYDVVEEIAPQPREVLPLHALASAAVRGTPIASLPEGGKRDWVSAPYVAAALEWMLTAPLLEHSLYNVGAGATWHPRDFAAALAGCGFRLKEDPAGSRPLSTTRTYLDMRRLGREFQPPLAPEAAVSPTRGG